MTLTALFPADQKSEEDERSPKRQIEENSDEDIPEQPPVKRGREKAAKKETASKRGRKAKSESPPVG